MKDKLRNDEIDGLAGEPIHIEDQQEESPKIFNKRKKNILLIVSILGAILSIFFLGFLTGRQIQIDEKVEIERRDQRINKLGAENRILQKERSELANQIKMLENNLLNKISKDIEEMQGNILRIEEKIKQKETSD